MSRRLTIMLSLALGTLVFSGTAGLVHTPSALAQAPEDDGWGDDDDWGDEEEAKPSEDVKPADKPKPKEDKKTDEAEDDGWGDEEDTSQGDAKPSEESPAKPDEGDDDGWGDDDPSDASPAPSPGADRGASKPRGHESPASGQDNPPARRQPRAPRRTSGPTLS